MHASIWKKRLLLGCAALESNKAVPGCRHAERKWEERSPSRLCRIGEQQGCARLRDAPHPLLSSKDRSLVTASTARKWKPYRLPRSAMFLTVSGPGNWDLAAENGTCSEKERHMAQKVAQTFTVRKGPC